ncbi:hypothetical protein BJY24_000787 [Nocardia transvalensis]|uniref:SnoaL-like domain-containing protein n=1 Tax=Nocardia transvalensis TaxID=37333 RepID=A0A7W9P9N2_9NOCA|nr:nuclear transport factor 2 family protein [Nocardia transvalensis]MBB5911920.1 hypothetical protein [Nocardia transvalensis]
MTTTDPASLVAAHELSQAKARYCLALDTKDWEGFAGLLCAEAEFDVSDGGTGVAPIVGREAVVEMIRTSLSGARTAHQVHTPLIEIDGDTATVVWAMHDRVLWDNGTSLSGYGHYHERWIRRDSAWQLAALRLTRLIVELSRPGD